MPRSPARLVAAILVVVLLSSVSGAAPILDQVSPVVAATFSTSDWANWQQEVVAGVTGQLVGIDLWPGRSGGSFDVSVNLGPAWQSDANDFQGSIASTVGGSWNHVDVSAAGIMLAAGDPFVIGIQGHPSNATVKGSAFPGAYAPGLLFQDGSLWDSGNWDIAFRTHVEPIPEPGTLGLLALGGLTLLACRRRRS